LEFFKSQSNLNPRQSRWSEYISRFDFKISYIDGQLNKVADCLSRYYQQDTPTTTCHLEEYIDADARLDKDGDDLPQDLSLWVGATQTPATLRRIPAPDEEIRTAEASELDVPAIKSVANNTDLFTHTFETHDILDSMRASYLSDKLFKPVMENISHYPWFSLRDNKLWNTLPNGDQVMCVPRTAKQKGRKATEILISNAHELLGHFGKLRTTNCIRRYFWWPTLAKEVDKFCKSCHTCQTVKSSPLHPDGLLHSLPIPNYPWESIGMDFLGPFRKSNGFDYLLVMIDRLSSMVHLVPTITTANAVDIARLYYDNIVRLHGIPRSIVSD
jgi:hypothetical protein